MQEREGAGKRKSPLETDPVGFGAVFNEKQRTAAEILIDDRASNGLQVESLIKICGQARQLVTQFVANREVVVKFC
jgi:hypothetical protein